MKNLILFSLIITFCNLANSQIVNIPDSYFKSLLVAHIPVIDTNEDGEIQVSEASSFSGKLDIKGLAWFACINDMTGLEAFINITSLDCSGNNISKLDVSNNQALQQLWCMGSSSGTGQQGIDSLVINNNAVLTYLNCGYNYITSLDVSNNINLDTLICEGNLLTEIDANNNTALTYLNCTYNHLISLNLKNGNNSYLLNIDARANINLYCIEVDDSLYSTTNWTDIDPQSFFSEDCTTRIDEEFQTTEITFSPNPFTEHLLIEFEKESDYQIRIIDMLGKEILSSIVNGSKHSLSTSSLPVGTYLLQLISENGVEIKKVIKN